MFSPSLRNLKKLLAQESSDFALIIEDNLPLKCSWSYVGNMAEKGSYHVQRLCNKTELWNRIFDFLWRQVGARYMLKIYVTPYRQKV